MKKLNKLYGEIDMKWLTVILYAIGTAILTAIFLLVPIFKGTSFERMGIYLESWIFFAVIIMANCKKPLESALKTFVFFLISQPLIYLIQVPFSDARWGLFVHYKYWFIATILTFPMAFVGWYITKKNWLSVLVLAPVLGFLGYTAFDCKQIIAIIFCALQIVLYILIFFPKVWQKIVGILIPVITVVIALLVTPKVDTMISQPVPDERTFSDSATLTVADSSFAEIKLADPAEGSIETHAHDYGETKITITDNGKDYTYTLRVYKDDQGIDRIEIK